MLTDRRGRYPTVRGLRLACWLAGFLILIGCGSIGQDEPAARPTLAPQPTPTLLPTATLAPEASPTSSIQPDSGWQSLRVGLERRVINLVDEQGQLQESLYILRLDQAAYRFEVGYQPGQPLSLLQWQEQSGALLVVNGGYFTEAYEATGLVISSGQTYGASYHGFGGMLAVDERGPSLRWLVAQPYTPDESLLAGLQSFPMLIQPGGQIGMFEDDGSFARRTVIAQDATGQMLFILASQGRFSLTDMGQFLASSDLGLYAALNLDGGASTGLLLREPAEGIVAYSLLPTVILVFPQ